MDKRLGVIKSPKDLRNYRISKAIKSIDLPKGFELNHTHIKNQLDVGSCVAHSVSSVLEFKDNINYSTGWIYGYRPSKYYQGKGMVILNALNTIKNVGYIPNDDLNLNVEVPEAIDIVNKNLDNYLSIASAKKIGSYAELKSLEEVKQAIYSFKTPVILAIDIDDNGLNFDEDFVAYVPDKINGGHAVMCYGWNEKGLLIQNSWGEDWGNNGTFILPYTYSFFEAWLINFDKTNDNESSITKPNYYKLREIIMTIINLIKKIINKLRESE